MNSNKFIEFYEFLKNNEIKIEMKEKNYDCDKDFQYFDEWTPIYLNKERLIEINNDLDQNKKVCRKNK